MTRTVTQAERGVNGVARAFWSRYTWKKYRIDPAYKISLSSGYLVNIRNSNINNSNAFSQVSVSSQGLATYSSAVKITPSNYNALAGKYFNGYRLVNISADYGYNEYNSSTTIVCKYNAQLVDVIQNGTTNVYIEDVTSFDRNAYPDAGEQDGYYYEFIE